MEFLVFWLHFYCSLTIFYHFFIGFLSSGASRELDSDPRTPPKTGVPLCKTGFQASFQSGGEASRLSIFFIGIHMPASLFSIKFRQESYGHFGPLFRLLSKVWKSETDPLNGQFGVCRGPLGNSIKKKWKKVIKNEKLNQKIEKPWAPSGGLD